MTPQVTQVQRLSMRRAEESISLLRAQMAALRVLDDMVTWLSSDRAYLDKFCATVAARVKALNESREKIFRMAPWRDASEHHEELRKAIARVEHCGRATAYPERKEIIESALAEAKDLIEKCIAFLDHEAHRFPEQPIIAKVPDPLRPDDQKLKTALIEAKPKVIVADWLSVKLPFGLGTVDIIKFTQWIKQLWQR